jgi:hypothetical protein
LIKSKTMIILKKLKKEKLKKEKLNKRNKWKKLKN